MLEIILTPFNPNDGGVHLVTSVFLVLLGVSIPAFALIDSNVYHFSFWDGLKNVLGEEENQSFLFISTFGGFIWSLVVDYRLRKMKKTGAEKKKIPSK